MEKTKICLVNPDAPGLLDKLAYPPIGLLYIAAVLEKDGFSPQYINLCEDPERDIPDAELYGISIHSIAVLAEGLKVAKKIREKKGANITIVAGGAAVTSSFKKVLDDGLIDIAVIGEGEMTMLDIVRGFPLKDIRGIAYKHDNNEIRLNPQRPLIANLNTIPFPARHLVPIDILKSHSGVHGDVGISTTSIMTSRGCPYSCAYCYTKHWRREFRARSPQNVIEEVCHIKEKYDISHLRFMDDTFTLDKKRVNEIASRLIPHDISYIAISRADRLDEFTLNMMKKSGCVELLIGVETGSPELLRKMNKGETVEHYKWAIKAIKNVGIKAKIFLLFGFPGENSETIRETKAFLEETQPDKVHMATFIPLPGTDVWEHPEKYNMKINDTNLEEFWFYWEPEEVDKGFVAELPNTSELMKLRTEMITYLRNEEWKYENTVSRFRKNSYFGKSATELA